MIKYVLLNHLIFFQPRITRIKRISELIFSNFSNLKNASIFIREI